MAAIRPLPGSDSRSQALAKEAFTSALASLRVAPAIADRLLTRLEDRYHQRGRHYHDLNHVAAMATLAARFRHLFLDRSTVSLAIWYHDAVYRSRRSDNEEASAQLAASDLGPLIPTHAVEAVRELILETKTHQPNPNQPDSGPFLDLDLAILGSAPLVYDLYADAIRAEYRWVPAFIYRTKRAEVLRMFLARPTIYFTAELRARWESSARENLVRELRMLA